MRMARWTVCLVLIGAATSALALPAIRSAFRTQYKFANGSGQDKAGCALCHVGSTLKRNPYGAELEKAMRAAASRKVTPAIFAKVEGLDSDKDGVRNGIEIRKGTLPGDPKSK